MRPRSILRFERLLWAALAIDLIANIASRNMLADGLARRGIAATPGLLLVSCLLSPIIGLILWYFVARRRSGTARGLIALLVAIGVVATVWAIARGLSTGGRALLWIGALTELLKVIAIAQLFRADASLWFAGADEA
jgi:hypothetical protein